MKIFITGGTGFIGTEVVKEAIARGHEVVGLARSDKSAALLQGLGATAVHGSLDDLEVISNAAKASDGVIHLAFTNDFSDFDGAVQKDINVITTIGEALIGSDKPFVNTSGTLTVQNLGRPATEQDFSEDQTGRAQSEALSLSFAKQGVRATAVRLAPTVHDVGRQGFGTIFAQMAARQGKTGYVAQGTNVWPSVHRKDAAKLFVDALETGTAGQVYNAVAEEGVSFKAIIQVIADAMHLPVNHFTDDEADTYFGWFAQTATTDDPTSSVWTQQALDWHPIETDLLSDMRTFLANPDNIAQLKK
ncbi:SDR family oxidoreductase [Lacticaseibacillus brantae]|nr:SDR family oxidoreductase [Lacticaseibacillus brantae]